MNKVVFLYKFYINKHNRGNYNWDLLFPFAGVIIGCMTVALTLAIMDGMEYAIFNKLKNVSFPAKLTHLPNGYNYEIDRYLIDQQIDYVYGMEGQALIMKDGSFRFSIIHGIDDLKTYRKKIFGNDLLEMNIVSEHPVIYMGRSLAIKLNIILGDTVDIATFKKINIFTGLPLKQKMKNVLMT